MNSLSQQKESQEQIFLITFWAVHFINITFIAQYIYCQTYWELLQIMADDQK